MGADFKPGDEQIVLDNGLPIEVVGNGADPVYLSGVPIIKVRAEHAAPVDTEAAIAMGREEDGDYKLVYEDGQVIERENVDDVDGSVSMDDAAGSDLENTEEMLETDGGQTTPPGEAVDHRYDTSAQGNAEGVAFSLQDATNYAPFSLNPGALKKAYDIGKREGQNWWRRRWQRDHQLNARAARDGPAGDVDAPRRGRHRNEALPPAVQLETRYRECIPYSWRCGIHRALRPPHLDADRPLERCPPPGVDQ